MTRRRWERFSDETNRMIEGMVSFLGIAMACVMGIQVVSRYVLNHSLFWSEEVGRISLVWLTFLGSTIAYKRKLHIGIEFIVRKLSPSVRRYCFFGVWGASTAFFLAVVVLGMRFLFFASFQKTAALGIPVSITYAVIPMSGLVSLIHSIAHFLETRNR